MNWGLFFSPVEPCVSIARENEKLETVINGRIPHIQVNQINKHLVFFKDKTGAVVGRKQQFTNESTSSWLFGTLQNRSSLHDELGNTGLNDANDAEFINNGFQKYGTSLFPRLDGSFTIVIYQHADKSLYLVADKQGDSYSYYTQVKNGVVIASAPDFIFTVLGVKPEIEPQAIALWFANYSRYRAASYFKNIFSLSGGKFININSERIKLANYWQFPLNVKYQGSSKKQAFEKFYSLLDEAVNTSIKNVDKCAALISGGMDSTSVTAIMMQSENRPEQVLAVTHSLDRYKECEETEYARSLCNRLGIELLAINVDDCLPLSGDVQNLHTNINQIWVPPLVNQRHKSYSAMHELGYKHFLTGEFGDHLFGAQRYWLKDLIKCSSSIDLIFAALRYQYKKTSHWYHDDVFRRLLPFNGLSGGYFNIVPDYLTPHAKQLMKSSDIKYVMLSGFEKDRYQSCLSHSSSTLRKVLIEGAQPYGLTPLMPFRDFKLMEFTLNLPTHYFFDFKSGLTKHILREVMSDKLPESIYKRRGKTNFNPIIKDSLNHQHRDIVKQILLDENRSWTEYVREDCLIPIINAPVIDDKHIFLIWNCVCYELWCQHLKRLH